MQPEEAHARLRILEEAYLILPSFDCKGLCEESCGTIGMTNLERARIEAKTGKPIGFIDKKTGACPLLVDGKCSVYDVRPGICRLWGSVSDMTCPHGCGPKTLLTPAEGRAFLATVEYASGGSLKDFNTLPRHLLDMMKRNLRRIQQERNVKP